MIFEARFTQVYTVYKKKHTPKNNILWTQDMSQNNKTTNFTMIFRLYFKVIVKPSFWFDNDLEIESKYHRKICCLVVLAHILSSQDVVFRSMFFLIFY